MVGQLASILPPLLQPGSWLHAAHSAFQASPSAADGHNEVIVRLRFVSSAQHPPPLPISLPARFPLSHRCSQCHPTETPMEKTVLCVFQRRAGQDGVGLGASRTPWEMSGRPGSCSGMFFKRVFYLEPSRRRQTGTLPSSLAGQGVDLVEEDDGRSHGPRLPKHLWNSGGRKR